MAERSRSEDRNENANGSGGGLMSIIDELPVDRLKGELQHALSVATERTAEAAAGKISDLTDRLGDFASGGGVAGKALAEGGKAAATGGSPLMGALKGGVMGAVDKAKDVVSGGSGGKGGKGGKKKITTIIESIDVGVPVEVAYNQWTQFQEFSGFMKKVENVEQKSDEKVDFKAKILWSHRTWEATILDQVPEKQIVWRSKGQKGHVDGSVTFHELADNLTRILVVLEYYPQGMFEKVGNIWRAQGRRARVELKQFQRHVMTNVILHPDEVDGWRGEIHDARVERTDEEAGEDEEYDEDAGDEYEDEGESDEDQPDDEYDDGEPSDEDEYAEEDEYEDEDEGEADEDQPEDEYDDEEPSDEDEYAEEDEYEDEDEGEADEDQPEDEYDDEEASDEDAEAEPAEEADEYEEDEYEDEGEADEEQPEDEYDDEEASDEDAEAEPAEEADEYEEDEYEDEGEANEDEPEDEYEDDEDEDEDEYEDEPDERPRRRAS